LDLIVLLNVRAPPNCLLIGVPPVSYLTVQYLNLFLNTTYDAEYRVVEKARVHNCGLVQTDCISLLTVPHLSAFEDVRPVGENESDPTIDNLQSKKKYQGGTICGCNTNSNQPTMK
jgi:hypothetical protein